MEVDLQQVQQVTGGSAQRQRERDLQQRLQYYVHGVDASLLQRICHAVGGREQHQTHSIVNGDPVVGFLYSISNGGNREYWPIHVGTNIIGREDSADITLREATVSSRHAEIRVRELRTGNGLTATIQDLGSKTGILINDTDPGYDLQKCCNGDILTIGENYRLLVIFVDTAANGLDVSPNFMPIAEQKEEETEIPSFGKGVNPYDRNLRSSQPGTVNLSGNDPIINAGGTMIME